MTITRRLFEAHLKCPTKCWLRFVGETPSGNPYAEWVQTQTESYRADAAKQLMAAAPAEEHVVARRRKSEDGQVAALLGHAGAN